MRKADPNYEREGVGGWVVEEERRSCEVCKSVNDTSHFKRRDINETFSILRGPLDFNSNHVIYLLE